MGRHLKILFIPGFLLGAISIFSPGSLLIALLVVGTWLLMNRIRSDQERRFVRMLFLIGFCARMVLSLGLDLGSWIVERQPPIKHSSVKDWDLGIVDKTREYMKMGDSDYYSQRGYAIAQFAKGVREAVVLFRITQYGWNGYVYVIGAFYYLFDFSPIAVKGINCFLGALLGVILFFLVKRCFNLSVARWASLGAALFPSLMMWSASNLKDTSLFFLTALFLLLFLKIQEARSWRLRLGYGLLVAGVLGAHATLRSPAFSLSLLGCVLFAQGLLFLARRRFLLLLAVAGIGLFVARGRSLPLDPQAGLKFAFYRHIGYSEERGVSYRYLPDKFYSPGYFSKWMATEEVDAPLFLHAASRAVFHFLTEPLPWKMDSLSQLLAVPQMVGWYLVLLFAFMGIFFSLGWNFHRTFFLVSVLTAWTLMGALTNGNVGTAFRIRDMVTPFFLIFACAGLFGLVNRQIRFEGKETVR